MVAGAILVVGPLASGPGSGPQPWGTAAGSPQVLAGCSIPCLEVLGQSVLHRTIGRLLRSGVQPITVVADGAMASLVPRLAARFVAFDASSSDSWPSVESTFAEYAHRGVETVLLIRLGAYAELNFADLARFHRQRTPCVTRAQDGDGPLDLWCITVSGCATPSLRCMVVEPGETVGSYFVRGYVNRLATAYDLRRLAVDGLLARCSVRPGGREVRPGVWIEESAQVHRDARIVPPAYIGHKSRLRAACLVTRHSNLERGAQVDYGTAIEDSTVLAHTYLGPGLDVAHAVVCGSHLVDLRRDLELEICDSKLIAGTSFSDNAVRSRAVSYLLALGGRWTTFRTPRGGALGR